MLSNWQRLAFLGTRILLPNQQKFAMPAKAKKSTTSKKSPQVEKERKSSVNEESNDDKPGMKRSYPLFERSVTVENGEAKKRKPGEPLKIFSWNVAGLNACVKASLLDRLTESLLEKRASINRSVGCGFRFASRNQMYRVSCCK